jgi:ABC-type uncharacterized transport system YnjBCD permease subunit
MKRVEHYEAAEKWLNEAEAAEIGSAAQGALVALAQVHAILATYTGLAYTAEAETRFYDGLANARRGRVTSGLSRESNPASTERTTP